MVNNVAAACRAFGDPQRLKIIRILASRQEEELCVTDLSKILRISQPAVSQHIKILKDIKGIDFIYFTEKDVVRHDIIQKIIKAYESYDKVWGGN